MERHDGDAEPVRLAKHLFAVEQDGPPGLEGQGRNGTAAEDAEGRVAKWIAEKSYPFAADDKSPEREAFDEGVADMRSHLDSFDSLPPSERTYLFSLLRRSIGGRA